MLQLTHPEVSARTCDECLRWIFDTESGRLVRNRETVEPIERPQGTKTPCLTCPKCNYTDERNPETGRASDLTKRNRLMLFAYYKQQISPVSVDDVGRHVFGIIQEVLTNYDRRMQRTHLIALLKK